MQMANLGWVRGGLGASIILQEPAYELGFFAVEKLFNILLILTLGLSVSLNLCVCALRRWFL